MTAPQLAACPWPGDERRTIALAALVEGRRYATDLQRPVWDFAVDWPQLAAAGLTINDLRWLLAKGYVDLANEIGRTGLRAPRRFRATAVGGLSPRTCIAITATGVAFADAQLANAPIDHLPRGSRAPRAKRPPKVPHWDAATRKLWFGKDLIKQFKVPAKNQELVLAAFEEDGWPPCTDDPLPPQDGIDSKSRLHDTIIRLNRSHKTKRIRFHGNGNGLAVHWVGRRIQSNASTRSTPK
jgi:hypothetical protein